LLGLRWSAAPVDLDEDAHMLADPLLGALNVALAKGRAVGVSANANSVALAADTVVAVDGEALAKPGDAEEAGRMLARLRGRAHEVLTGVVLRRGRREWAAVVSTQVLMREYGEREVQHYIERGEPFDKAGGYAIQDTLFAPVERLEGCYLNVVGLPLCAVSVGLAALGTPTKQLRDARPPCEFCRAGAALVKIEVRGSDPDSPG
jgi:MAF protein